MGTKCKVRVRRTTSETHQFLKFIGDVLERVDCPKGWMSPEGTSATLIPRWGRCENGKQQRSAVRASEIEQTTPLPLLLTEQMKKIRIASRRI
jgi:hypothetical protein